MRNGPTSPDGKSRSSMNRLSHGCCSEKLILPNENAADWNALLQAWFDDYAPADGQPHPQTWVSLLEATARAEWFLWRKTSQYNECEQSLFAKYTGSIDWTEEDHLKIERFTRYRTTAERTFHRLRHDVEQTRRTRHLEAHRAQMLELRLAEEARREEKQSEKKSEKKSAKDTQRDDAPRPATSSQSRSRTT